MSLFCKFIFLTSLAGAEVVFGASALDAVAKIEACLAPKNVKAVYAFTNHRLDGTISRYKVAFDIGDVDRARGRFLEPEREKGREILRLDNEIWTYIPSAGRIVRVADRDSFAGGDFSNADVLRVDWAKRYQPELKKNMENQWVIEFTAKTKDASYARFLLWVDKKSLQPVQQVFFDSRGTALKRLRYGDVKTFGSISRPARLVMENLITKQSSELLVHSFQQVQSLPASLFITDNLGK